MKIAKVVCVPGRSGYMHRDLAAIKAGARPDIMIFHGDPVTPGFKKIVEPATVISVMLLLEDGQVAFGDCVDVILAGIAGRDGAFNAEDHLAVVRGPLSRALAGMDVSRFRANADVVEAFAAGGSPLHTAVRYGVTQALLHATSLAGRQTMAEVIAQEYDVQVAGAPIPILASCHKDDPMQLDRVILKRFELLPHASFTLVDDHVGRDGEKLIAFVANVVKRIGEIGDPDYHPRIHVDVYGTLGELFGMRLDAIAGYLAKLRKAAGRFGLLVESPIIAHSQAAQIESFAALRSRLRDDGTDVGLIADEWCNTLADIGKFARASACDFVQVKTPDLGGIQNSIEALLLCRKTGMGACLGGTANETDQSARICTHIGLACQPSFMLSKPGLGTDEALMIQTNEMARTLALIAERRSSRG